jgi:hypothetical protein
MKLNDWRTVMVAAMIAVPHAGWATTYTPGNYLVTSYFVSNTGTQGVVCAVPAGTYLTSIYSYPGPGRAGATARQIFNGLGYNTILRLNFPVTPAAGATTWSGNVTETYLPGGVAVSVPFSSAFTVTDSLSYVATTTYVVPVTGGTCTAVVQETGVWTAK